MGGGAGTHANQVQNDERFVVQISIRCTAVEKKYAPQAADCVALRFTKRYRKLFKLRSCLILVMGSKALALGCMELAKAATD